MQKPPPPPGPPPPPSPQWYDDGRDTHYAGGDHDTPLATDPLDPPWSAPPPLPPDAPPAPPSVAPSTSSSPLPSASSVRSREELERARLAAARTEDQLEDERRKRREAADATREKAQRVTLERARTTSKLAQARPLAGATRPARVPAARTRARQGGDLPRDRPRRRAGRSLSSRERAEARRCHLLHGSARWWWGGASLAHPRPMPSRGRIPRRRASCRFVGRGRTCAAGQTPPNETERNGTETKRKRTKVTRERDDYKTKHDELLAKVNETERRAREHAAEVASRAKVELNNSRRDGLALTGEIERHAQLVAAAERERDEQVGTVGTVQQTRRVSCARPLSAVRESRVARRV